MQLVLNTYGAGLRKNGECFEISVEDKKQELSVKKVTSILISTAVWMSSDALKMALDNNIDVVFIDKYGDPYGRLWHSKLGSTTYIRRRQLEASCSEEGLAYVLEWSKIKLENQREFLKKLHARREGNEVLPQSIAKIDDLIKKFDTVEGLIEPNRGTIMGYEGNASKAYFEAISSVMPQKYCFTGRSKRPAKDEFNAMLNYGYGVLYSKVEKACLIAGLEPYMGFLHADNYNKKSLVFDLIELYRNLIDQVVVHAFTGKQVKDSFFKKFETGMTLNKEGKAFLISSLNKMFEETVRYKNRNIKNLDKIQFDCHDFAKSLIEGV